MGAADVVPGVSGGTIAFITGIYDNLLSSINAISFKLIGTWRDQGFKEVWNKVNGTFLLILFSGIFTSIITLARLLKYLLENHPVYLWSFFFGLIIASVFYVGKMIEKWRLIEIVACAVGAVLIYLISTIPQLESNASYFYIFICGAIAICAMILPGISGSFLLLILGAYETILGAVSDFKIGVLAVFMSGALIGLLSFSRFLKWVLEAYRNVTLAVLTGFLLGSLYKIWPWKLTLKFRVNSHGEEVPYIQENILPQSDWPFALVFCVIGFLLLFGIERLGKRIDSN